MPRRRPCECADKLCPAAHTGTSACDQPARITLYRADMIDYSGTRFCEACADDAVDSGLFTPKGA